MYLIENELYHVYNRGNNQQQLFFSERDYDLFLNKLRHHIAPCCNVLTWCLMPNHFHLMISANGQSCVNRSSFGGKPMQEFPYRIGMALSSYSQQINKRNKTTGSLFQQKTKALSVNEAMQRAQFKGTPLHYITKLMHNHHYNPVKAGLVEKMEDWPWSSFRECAGWDGRSLGNVPLLMAVTGYTPDTFYEDSYRAVAAW